MSNGADRTDEVTAHGTVCLFRPGTRPLPTPLGTFQIIWKVTGTEFISPWPPGSAFYRTPVHVNFAMLYLDGGFFPHDAT